jgi:hypothetical protein
MVDLAGSERQSKTQATGDRLKVLINKTYIFLRREAK